MGVKIATKSQLLDYYRGKVVAYNIIFPEKSPVAQDVLNDLKEFCFAEKTTFHADARIHAVAEGRREVWLRIQTFLTLDPLEILEKYTKELPQSNENKENKK